MKFVCWVDDDQPEAQTMVDLVKQLRDGAETASPESLRVMVKWGADEIERLRNIIPVWMTARGYATGHGDTIEDMLGELEAQAMKRATSNKSSNPSEGGSRSSPGYGSGDGNWR